MESQKQLQSMAVELADERKQAASSGEQVTNLLRQTTQLQDSLSTAEEKLAAAEEKAEHYLFQMEIAKESALQARVRLSDGRASLSAVASVQLTRGAGLPDLGRGPCVLAGDGHTLCSPRMGTRSAASGGSVLQTGAVHGQQVHGRERCIWPAATRRLCGVHLSASAGLTSDMYLPQPVLGHQA